MAEKLKNKISTFNLPDDGKVVDSEWRDDIDTDYATQEDVSQDFEIYGNNEKQEGEYISPKKVSKESLSQIKNFQVKLAFSGLKKLRTKELKAAA